MTVLIMVIDWMVKLLFPVKIAGKWAVYLKMGEAGWKSLIPFYSDYLLYEKLWNIKMFWVHTVTMIVTIVTGIIAKHMSSNIFLLMLVLVLVNGMIRMIVHICMMNRLAKVFGHGSLYTFGLFVAQPIFQLILGFGGSCFDSALCTAEK